MVKKDGGRAFPNVDSDPQWESFALREHPGMTMRQAYKLAALQGLAACGDYAFYGESLAPNVRRIGEIADAMIAEDEEAAN